MTRRISAAFCVLALTMVAQSVDARPHFYTGPIRVSHINWGSASSSGEITVLGLPAIQSARETTRRSSRTGERLNRPEFGAGTSDKSSARPSGRRVHKPIRITKRVDKASPMLRRAHAVRRKLPLVVMTGRDSSGAYLKYELKDVRITSYSVSGSGHTALETIMFVYDRIRRVE